MSDALAVALQRRGVRAGDRVAMYLQNIPQVMLTVLAAWKCGAAVVPCNPMLRERELVKILGDAGCRVLICQDDLYSDVVARRAVHDWRAPHHHDVRARLSRAGRGRAANPRRLAPDATRGRSRPPGVGGPARRPEPDAGADHRRRRGLHGLHVGHDGRAQGGDEHPQKRRFRDFGLPKVDRVHRRGRDSRPRAAVSRHRAHRPRGAGAPDRKPADPVLPVRRGRSLPARRDASGDVHGVGSHGVHRAPQQQRDGQARPVLADEGLHRRRADAAGGAGRMARAHRHPHPADVRSDRSDVADAHDAPRRRRRRSTRDRA